MERRRFRVAYVWDLSARFEANFARASGIKSVRIGQASRGRKLLMKLSFQGMGKLREWEELLAVTFRVESKASYQEHDAAVLTLVFKPATSSGFAWTANEAAVILFKKMGIPLEFVVTQFDTVAESSVKTSRGWMLEKVFGEGIAGQVLEQAKAV